MDDQEATMWVLRAKGLRARGDGPRSLRWRRSRVSKVMTGVRELLIGEDSPSRVVLLLIDH